MRTSQLFYQPLSPFAWAVLMLGDRIFVCLGGMIQLEIVFVCSVCFVDFFFFLLKGKAEGAGLVQPGEG